MKYSESELEDSLRRAFVDRGFKAIMIDSRRDRFLIESAQLGVSKGWLNNKFVEVDEQSCYWEFWLTDEGKKHFGL